MRRTLDLLRALARDLWSRENWSAEMSAALAAFAYCGVSIAFHTGAVRQPGFATMAGMLTRVGLPHAFTGLKWFGVVCGVAHIVALLRAHRTGRRFKITRAAAIAGTSWLLTGLVACGVVSRPEPSLVFPGTLLAASLWGLAKLSREPA